MANPNPDTSGIEQHQFKPGQSGNPGGKTAEHRQAEVEAAELAALLTLKMVKAIGGKIEEMEGGEEPDANAAINAIKGDVLRLLKDAQDRGYGTPVQSVNHESPNGTLTPVTGFDVRIVDAASGNDDEAAG